MEVELRLLNEIAQNLKSLSAEFVVSYLEQFLEGASISDWASRVFQVKSNDTVIEHSYLIGVNKTCALPELSPVLQTILNVFYMQLEWSFDVGDVRGFKIRYNSSQPKIGGFFNLALPLLLQQHRQLLIKFVSTLPCVVYIAEDSYLKLYAKFANSPTCIQPPNQAGLFGHSLELWGLDQIDGVTDSRYSFQLTGAGVTIYVLDSGINAKHNDFGSRASVIYTASSVAGISIPDCSGHGTHVSGVAAGQHTGVAKGATVNVLRIIGCGEVASVSDVVAALSHLNSVLKRPAVINMSLGSADAEDVGPTLPAIMQAYAQANVPMVVSAGNAGKNICLSAQSLTTVPKTIVVGALAADSKPTSFSNFGPCVRFWAPGLQIWSASHLGATDYRSLDGTSQAAPFVTGIVALILERFPDATVERVLEILNSSSRVLNANNMRVSVPVLTESGPTSAASAIKYPYATCPSLFALDGILFWALAGLLVLSLTLCCACIIIALCRCKKRRMILKGEAKKEKNDAILVNAPQVTEAIASTVPVASAKLVSRTQAATLYLSDEGEMPDSTSLIFQQNTRPPSTANIEPLLEQPPIPGFMTLSTNDNTGAGHMGLPHYRQMPNTIAGNSNYPKTQRLGSLPAAILNERRTQLPNLPAPRLPNAPQSPILYSVADDYEASDTSSSSVVALDDNDAIPDRLDTPVSTSSGPGLLLPQLPQVVRNRRSSTKKLQNETENDALK